MRIVARFARWLFKAVFRFLCAHGAAARRPRPAALCISGEAVPRRV